MTKARAEWGVHKELRRQGYATLYLHYQGKVKHARRVIAVLKPFFPRYLFVGLEDGQSLYDIAETRGVVAVLSNADGPLEVPSREIERLARGADADGRVDTPRRKPDRALSGARTSP